MMMKFNHPYHLVSLSPWPLMNSFCLMIFMFSSLKFMHDFNILLFLMSLILMIMIIYQWWRDVIREGTFQGAHTLYVMKMLRSGMILFILSELMFFLSFFWCYFHMNLSPSVEIGSVWPPNSILVFNPFNIPLLNTIILLSSGVSITLCHHSIMNKKLFMSNLSILITLILGMIFTFFQYLEYQESYFSMSDSVYGSIFFMATGFHGIHVIVGTLFILVSYWRLLFNHYSMFHHLGFEASSWYWHFVDVVWLFLYIFIYWLSF
nr:cytochrome c oxidase subunit III [Aphidius gifuensis]WLE65176.1 cytochrome c oxidase subunit III [Aphidius gifuensis]WLE65202.1 cytochrome c oxidase subunit III [Aphidius gifuensis]WLE65683.1 cytochrome c oxidase subunit III [Aphidius gifuensis]WLE65696.1 cytochrome c oxidase subunit III [Aphidius gifuensis]